MKIIKPSYEIRTDLPGNGIWVLKDLEEDARTCYKSEDWITEDGESARKLIKRLIDSGHLAMLEGFDIKVRFICDRGVSHELVRHRLCSFSQESTRYCNYSKDKFGNEITVIEPVIFEELDALYKNDVKNLAILLEHHYDNENTLTQYEMYEPIYQAYAEWYLACDKAENAYLNILNNGGTPEIARSVLPTCLKTEINMKANLREWRHIFKERTSERAHPEMRRLMIPLLFELHDKIPIIFDDIFEKVQHTAVK